MRARGRERGNYVMPQLQLPLYRYTFRTVVVERNNDRNTTIQHPFIHETQLLESDNMMEESYHKTAATSLFIQCSRLLSSYLSFCWVQIRL